MVPSRLLVVSLILYCIAVSAIGWRSYAALVGEVRRSTQETNRTFTRLFVNENWDRLKPALKLGGSPDEIRSNSLAEEADAVIYRFARGTDLVRVKIFDARGVVVYASDKTLFGQDLSTYPGVMAGIRGQVTTELIHRPEFRSLDGETRARDLVSSYVPVKGANGVEAVVEVYTDRTASIDAALSEWRQMLVFVGGMLAALLALALWTHAQMLRQRRKIERSHAQTLQLHEETTHELVCAEQEKLRFLWGVTQELHQPATKLLHTLQRMAPPIVSGQAAKLLQTAESQSLALQKRVQDFQTLVQLNRGKLETAQTPFHLGELIRRLGAALEHAAAQRPLEIICFVSPQVDHSFVGDGRRLQEVLTVLLDNALAVTASGGIQLRAHHGASGVELDVIDTGPGLTEAERQSFADSGQHNHYLPTTDHASLDDEDAHVSLGLVLAQGLTKAMGGTLDARSSGGSGAWFTLRLPLSRAAVTVQPAQQATPEPKVDTA